MSSSTSSLLGVRVLRHCRAPSPPSHTDVYPVADPSLHFSATFPSPFLGRLSSSRSLAALPSFVAGGPCKVIAPKYEALSKEYKQVVFLKVDVDKARDISTTAGVTAMPTFIVYKDGKKDKTIKGADARGLENAIRSAAGPPSQNASGTHSK